ncbi:glycosyltransferase family 2 protein, partial [Cobetia marina]|uniref:glycosyltransferase family 2 protein n=1 Tax=Cobetia marina TaxID=28258 RepID=UPI00384B432E
MKTRICAIAKDEGAYIADWIFHHIYFGFDELHIYLNRTTDLSEEILRAIMCTYPKVTYEKLDWIDNCPPEMRKRLQVLAYGKDLEVARSNNIDWWMCLDIDEFWVPRDFDTTIKNYVRLFPSDRPICFLWHNVLGEAVSFKPLSPNSSYVITPQIKTITPVKSVNIEFVRVHKPKYSKNVSPINADGHTMKFSEAVDQRADSSMKSVCGAYIAHQMYRSEAEYLATMIRGRPNEKKTLKTNRPGYKAKDYDSNHDSFAWPKLSYDSYVNAKNEFYQNIGVDEIVAAEKDNVKLNRLFDASCGFGFIQHAPHGAADQVDHRNEIAFV